MATLHVTRRAFLRLAAVFGLVGVAGCPMNGVGGLRTVFKRSGRGLCVSNTAKKHNANHLYATMNAALNDPTHSGDKSRVVSLLIPAVLFARLFPFGKVSADLRHDL